ncbi:1412_t:CDS:2, partial [Funneliformis geosporum]
KKPFTKNNRDNLLNVHRGDIFHRKDLRDGFGYALFGITVTLAIAGGVYVIVGITLAYFVDNTGIVQKLTNQLFKKETTSLKELAPQHSETTQLITYTLLATAIVGALTGFYEESLKNTVETTTSEFKTLLEQNIAYGQKTQRALVAIALGIFFLLLIAYFWK